MWPNLWRPDVRGVSVGPLTVWASTFVEHPTVRIAQDGRVIAERSWRQALVPNRPHAVTDSWESGVDPDGGPVVVSVG